LQLLGTGPSVAGWGTTIIEKAVGKPFFAEEMTRDLAERGVLAGDRGAYVWRAAEVGVPATIAARIDRWPSAP
jgi:adenylate cyclase